MNSLSALERLSLVAVASLLAALVSVVSAQLVAPARADTARAAVIESMNAAVALSEPHGFLNANMVAVDSSSNAEIVNDTNPKLATSGFSCVVPVSVTTAAAGIFVVDEGDADTTDGWGPFCVTTSECPAGAIIPADAKRAWVRRASGGSVNLSCGLGIR